MRQVIVIVVFIVSVVFIIILLIIIFVLVFDIPTADKPGTLDEKATRYNSRYSVFLGYYNNSNNSNYCYIYYYYKNSP